MKRVSEGHAIEVPLQIEMLKRSLSALAPALPNIEATLRMGPLAVLQTFDAGVERTKADPDLSEVGRHQAIAKAGRAAVVALDEWSTKQLTPLTARRLILERKLVPVSPLPTDPAERLSLELRRQEIRNNLRDLDPVERNTLFLTSQDPQIIDAMESAPPIVFRAKPEAAASLVPFVSPEHVEARRLARAEAANPAIASELRDVAVLERTYRSAVASARTALAGVLSERVEEP